MTRKEEKERLREGMLALTQDRLPAHVRRRLDEQRRSGRWSSTLSVAELAAIRSAGFTPAGQVMGSAVYHVGWLGMTGCASRLYPETTDMTPLSDALRHARDAALARMTREATALEAHGVIGVRVELRWLLEVAGVMEYTAIGTAIRRVGAPPLDQPFLSAVDGQGLAKLLRAGLVPCGLTYGICTLHLHPGRSRRVWYGAEVPYLSNAVNEARVRATRQVHARLEKLGAVGAVGSTTSLQVRRVRCRVEWTEVDYRVQFAVAGTAVMRFAMAERTAPTLLIHLQP